MRRSQLFTKTSKNIPADERAKNAQLLIQAGFIHKEMAGVYAFLPLGKRVLDNIAQIVREEMNAVGGQEVQMTVLQPKEIWEKTDRWSDEKVDNWFKTKLSNGTELGVGLTHEEPIVDALKDFVGSYKDLPLSVYQIQTKFRNELRAKSGLMRGREFTMKDMYTFSRSQEEHDEVYEKIVQAYHRVYERLGIGEVTFRTKADGGIFTKRFSDEFQTRTDVGEDTIFHVPSKELYFNSEIAPSQIAVPNEIAEAMPLQEVEGKDVIGVEALLKHLDITIEQSTKTLFYTTDNDTLIAAVVRADYSINEIKLAKAVGVSYVHLAEESLVKERTGAEMGYAGLLNLPDTIPVYIDDSLQGLCNFETGANKTNVHAINVNFGRDVPVPKAFYDFKEARLGDRYPETGEVYETFKACEVGNTFPLESKYTDALDLYFTNEEGKRQSIIMGCYGIGISRLVGMLVEHFADKKGMVWPENVAPVMVYLAPVGGNESVREHSEELYKGLTAAGIAVLYDDRDVRPGEKFADADLMGIPYRVVVSEKTLANNQYEVKSRTADQPQFLDKQSLLKMVAPKSK